MITQKSILLRGFHKVLVKLQIRQLFNKYKKKQARTKNISQSLPTKYLKFIIF